MNCDYVEIGCHWIEKYLLQHGEDKMFSAVLIHHGVKGQKWGVRHGPPYPLKRDAKNEKSDILKNAVGKNIIRVEHVDLTGLPNGITQVIRKNGGIDRNYYDESGRQTT